jgi:catechol 2,3-dioxygenase-like lactoylglutathione lyase family enzyme
MHLSYVGIRVTDLPRSIDFYREHFGLRLPEGTVAPTTTPKEPAMLLLVDPESNQRLELNYYPPGSPYAVPYVPGEGWDHLAFRVDDLSQFLERLVP